MTSRLFRMKCFRFIQVKPSGSFQRYIICNNAGASGANTGVDDDEGGVLSQDGTSNNVGALFGAEDEATQKFDPFVPKKTNRVQEKMNKLQIPMAVTILSATAYEFTTPDPEAREIRGVSFTFTKGSLADTTTKKGIDINKVSIATPNPKAVLGKFTKIPGYYLLEYTMVGNSKVRLTNVFPFDNIGGKTELQFEKTAGKQTGRKTVKNVNNQDTGAEGSASPEPSQYNRESSPRAEDKGGKQ